MTLRVSLTAALLVAATPAFALAPPLPTCYPEDGPEAIYGGYEPQNIGNGFVTFQTDVMGDTYYDWTAVLEYCPERVQLVVTVENYTDNAAVRDAAGEMFDTMLYGSASYTLEQMRDALRGIGARAEITTVTYESCACATFAGA